MLRHPSLATGPKKPLLNNFKKGVTIPLFFAFLVLFGTSAQATWTGEEFFAKESLKAGNVVVINTNNADSVSLAGYYDQNSSVGIIANKGTGLVNYTRDGANVSVALDGEVPALVSDINGVVKKGDLVGLSWLAGVAMYYSVTNDARVIGIALEDFSIDESVDYGEVETPEGMKNARIDAVRIRIVRQEGRSVASGQEDGLVGLLSSIAGKELTPERVMAGVTIFVVSMFIAGMFVTSSIRGSFISIGRNPMASVPIYKSLFHVSGISVIVVLIGATLAYVVLVL